jgi:hypothetical protein
MKIRTLAIHKATPPRMYALLQTLQRYGHTLTNRNDADIWFVDCIWPHALDQFIVDEILAFRGQIVLVSLGDLNVFKLDGLPDELIDKVSAFAKIQWDNNLAIYDPRILDKMITVHPFLIGGLPKPSTKKPKACFFGLPTGAQSTKDNLRIRACEILKSQPWFVGGIVGQEGGTEPRDISGVEIGHRPRSFYLRTINQSLLSLCMPGNSPLTYRMFETLGVGSAVVSCCLQDVRWLNCMEPDVHYLSVKQDLSDLLDVCEQAIHNDAQTNKIASAGYELHNNYYAIQSDGGLSHNIWQDIKGQFFSVDIIL